MLISFILPICASLTSVATQAQLKRTYKALKRVFLSKKKNKTCILLEIVNVYTIRQMSINVSDSSCKKASIGFIVRINDFQKIATFAFFIYSALNIEFHRKTTFTFNFFKSFIILISKHVQWII